MIPFFLQYFFLFYLVKIIYTSRHSLGIDFLPSMVKIGSSQQNARNLSLFFLFGIFHGISLSYSYAWISFYCKH